MNKLGAVGLYTDEEAIVIRGSRASLEEFARVLQDPKEDSSEYLLEIPTGASPNPYDCFLSRVIIELTESPAELSAKGDTLLIAGSNQNLRLVAHSFEHLARQPTMTHTHLEYMSELGFLSENSESLIIEKISLGTSKE